MPTTRLLLLAILAIAMPLSASLRADKVNLRAKSTADLLAMPRSEEVCWQLLSRLAVTAQQRQEALTELARLKRTDELTQLQRAIERLDASAGESVNDPLHDLTHLLTGRYADQLLTARDWLQKSALQSRHAILRQAAFAALLSVDRSVDPGWTLASRSSNNLRDLVDATPMVSDLAQRASLYPKLSALVNDAADSYPTNTNDDAKRELRHAAIDAITYIGGQETESARSLARLILSDTEQEAAIRSVRRIPRAFWLKQDLVPLADHLLRHLQELPASQRSTPAAIEAAQLCRELALQLPDQQSSQIRSTLNSLKMHTLLIRPVPHHMTYDRAKFYVAAGEPVEIVFHNTDLVPNNLVITEPGTSAEVGQQIELAVRQSTTAIHNFVPDSPKVLRATRMLSAGEFDTLRFVAPKTPGVYGIVCTYPGRWRTMYGALHVVTDLASVPAAEQFADAPIQSAPRAFVRDWKFDELANDLAQVDRGRSFDRGKYLYGALACAACHSWPGTPSPASSYLVGPELSDAGKRFKRAEILRDLLEPSKVINPKFQTQIIETGDGEIITGIVVREDSSSIRLLKDPRETCEPKDIRTDNIEARQPSKISMMPIGQMTTLSKDEIFDLLAYIVSGGDSNSAMFHE